MYLAALRNPSYDQGHQCMPPLLKAERDVQICPGWVARIPVEGPVKGRNKWFMERVILPTRNSCFLAAPWMLVRTKELVFAVANTSPSTEWIRKGDILGVLHNPEQYLNRAEKEDQTRCLRAYTQVVQKIAQGLLGDKDLLDQALAKSQALEIPSTPEDPDELWGPKTSEPTDPAKYNSQRLEELIDIAPDTPPDIKAKTLALINKWIQAFRFDDHLGTLDTVARIRMKEEAQPVSMPMYGASPVNRQVIEKQMDKWICQEVVEPSKSPWAAPVVIVY
jgi:hypothetical protein